MHVTKRILLFTVCGIVALASVAVATAADTCGRRKKEMNSCARFGWAAPVGTTRLSTQLIAPLAGRVNAILGFCSFASRMSDEKPCTATTVPAARSRQ